MHSVCVCVFIKLHITAQSGPVILVIICHLHWSSQGGIVCVCVCVCCHPIYSGRQICGRTSRSHRGGRSHRIFPPFSSAILALIFLVRRSFSPSTVKSNVCVLTISSFSTTCWTFFFCEEKSQFVWRHRGSNSRPNVRRFRGNQLNHRGDRLRQSYILT